MKHSCLPFLDPGLMRQSVCVYTYEGPTQSSLLPAYDVWIWVTNLKLTHPASVSSYYCIACSHVLQRMWVPSREAAEECLRGHWPSGVETRDFVVED
jgi:hypothetical protein